jgi:hypothetical protein
MNTLQTEFAEPRTAAELIARYQDVRRRLYAPIPCLKLTDDRTQTDRAPCKAIPIISEPSRLPEAPPYQTPAREAVRAVSSRTSVPVAEILGRNRRPPIVAARHEAVWRVRLVTGWSLPRLGKFFKRDHTTVLHSLREMAKRSARDPELRAYMLAVSSPPPASLPPPISCSRKTH